MKPLGLKVISMCVGAMVALACTPQPKRIFFFPNGSLGEIGDSSDQRDPLTIADSKCTARAKELSLGGGSWSAWLSSSGGNAIDRVGEGPWYRLDQQTLLFASKAELKVGPRVAIDPTDGGKPMRFWSGTGSDGLRSDPTCRDWTLYTSPLTGTVGRADRPGAAWVDPEPLDCSTYLALLCIEP